MHKATSALKAKWRCSVTRARPPALADLVRRESNCLALQVLKLETAAESGQLNDLHVDVHF